MKQPKTLPIKTDAPLAVGLHGVVVPRSVTLMLDKYNRSLKPHKRKRIEVACVIHATGIERAAQELEELARTLREGGVGYVGHGSGYYMSITHAVTKRHNGEL